MEDLQKKCERIYSTLGGKKKVKQRINEIEELTDKTNLMI